MLRPRAVASAVDDDMSDVARAQGIIFQSSDASDVERASYHTAVDEMLKRCASLPFTEAFGNGMAGQPFTMRLVDDRERPLD